MYSLSILWAYLHSYTVRTYKTRHGNRVYSQCHLYSTHKSWLNNYRWIWNVLISIRWNKLLSQDAKHVTQLCIFIAMLEAYCKAIYVVPWMLEYIFSWLEVRTFGTFEKSKTFFLTYEETQWFKSFCYLHSIFLKYVYIHLLHCMIPFWKTVLWVLT